MKKADNLEGMADFAGLWYRFNDKISSLKETFHLISRRLFFGISPRCFLANHTHVLLSVPPLSVLNHLLDCKPVLAGSLSPFCLNAGPGFCGGTWVPLNSSSLCVWSNAGVSLYTYDYPQTMPCPAVRTHTVQTASHLFSLYINTQWTIALTVDTSSCF